MNLSMLFAEHKKTIVLCACGVGVFIALLVLGIQFRVSSINTSSSELESLTTQIKQADSALKKRTQTTGELVETTTALRSYLTQIPPSRNYYSWATEIIYSKARAADLEIDAINEIINAAAKKMESKEKSVTIESYSLNIIAHGGYDHLKRFFHEFELTYPLVRFTNVDITKGREPEIHDIRMNIQWPFNIGDLEAMWKKIEEQQSAHGMREVQTEPSADQQVDTEAPDNNKSENESNDSSERKPDSAEVNSNNLSLGTSGE